MKIKLNQKLNRSEANNMNSKKLKYVYIYIYIYFKHMIELFTLKIKF